MIRIDTKFDTFWIIHIHQIYDCQKQIVDPQNVTNDEIYKRIT